jgi:hypothetical protein
MQLTQLSSTPSRRAISFIDIISPDFTNIASRECLRASASWS